jgi:hypothetical protein
LYGKLFESTFTGSMYGSGPVVFALWGYVIAHTKQDDLVEVNPRMVAGILGCTADEIETALDYLCAPDPKSRTKQEDGRRLIREGEYLFRSVNNGMYNLVRNEPQRREYNRIKQQESRARRAALSNADSADGQTMSSSSASVSVSVSESESEDSDRRERGANAPTPATQKAKASRIPTEFWLSPERQEYAEAKLPRVDAVALFEEFSDYWRALHGPKALKVDWDATWRTWVRRAVERYPTIRINGAQAEKVIRYDSKGRPREL